MKSLKAEKRFEGWIVTIIDTRRLDDEDEVHKLIRQEGLRIDGNKVKLNNKGYAIEIFAN